MLDKNEIMTRVDGHALVRSVDVLPKGHIRLETAFLYPDGSSVDVFVIDEAPLLKQLKLSDLGQTTSWLLDVQVKPWQSKKRQRFVEDALRLYHVKQTGGALECPLPRLDDVLDGVVRLGQACVRVADLTYTRRSSFQVQITEDVEEFLSDLELAYETDYELEGRHGKVRVDFFVTGPRVKSSVLTLSSGNASQAHIVANEIFKKWYDLNVPSRPEQRVTIFDDRVDVYRDDDLARLRELSDVVAFSDHNTVKDLLAA